jgi:hypothetical protein
MTPKSAPKDDLRVDKNRFGRKQRTEGPIMTPKNAPKVNLGPDNDP